MIFALFVMLAVPANDLPACDEEAAERGVQQEMNICAHREFLIADAAMNEQWRLTRAHMQERDEEWTSEYDERPGYFETLLAAQRAWLTYRDAHCQSEGYEARGGSLEPLLVSTCKRHLTEKRTEELRSLAETY